MLLRNKKTGEIKDWSFAMLQNVMQSTERKHYGTLARLNEEWEDYEEPKEYWYIDVNGAVSCEQTDDGCEFDNDCREIGNYFETKEEAEKAVEKLKAWKRLKDKGFAFTGISGISNDISVSFETDSKYDSGHIMYDEYSNTDDKLKEYNEDLMMLFGGEE